MTPRPFPNTIRQDGGLVPTSMTTMHPGVTKQRVPPDRPSGSVRAWLPVLLLVILFGGHEGLAQSSEAEAEMDDSAVAFVNVAVASMQDAALLGAQTVVVRGERIVSIGPTNEASLPTDVSIIDGSGRYLLPGLADMHVHVRAPFEDGPLYLNAGITTVLSLGTQAPDDDTRLKARERSQTPDFVGPTLYLVGSHISAGMTSAQAERIVREIVEQGFDLVKVYGEVSPEAFTRLHETANRLGIKTTGHAQRSRGMQSVYTEGQDLAHVEEYLYAEFNPDSIGFKRAGVASMLVLALLTLLVNVRWGLGTSWLRARRSGVKRWVRIFTGIAWLFFMGLVLSLPDPFAGVVAGNTAAIAVVVILMLCLLWAAVVLTLRVRSEWREGPGSIWNRTSLLFLVVFAWTFVASSGYLTPRIWRTSEAGLVQISQETAAAGIWVTPTLVVPDYNKRQIGDEFHTLIQRPEMRYLRPATRDRWINNNEYRRPAWLAPMQSAMWQNWAGLMSRLVGELHAAGVPLLAGSDAVGPHGVLPGSSLHEELSLMVQAGLTPYEALRTATVNAATYLNADQEFGRIAEGLRADLVLLSGNPLEDISEINSRVGVMRRGRWFSAVELEATLDRLAEARQ